jgi:hypothetical protein
LLNLLLLLGSRRMTFGEYLRRERRIAQAIKWGGVGVMCIVAVIATRLFHTTKDLTVLAATLGGGAVVGAALLWRMRSLKCPRCRASLVGVSPKVLYGKGITLEACPRCGLRAVESFTTIVK